MTHSLLLYGTLRSSDSEPVVVKGYKMYDIGWFPGVVFTGKEEDTIVCEAIDGVTADGLSRLDSYEGFNIENPEHSLYIRRECRGKSGYQIYEYNRTPVEDNVVPGGDWLKHETDRKRVDNSHMVKREEEEGESV